MILFTSLDLPKRRLFELGVLAAIIAVLAYVFIVRLARVQEAAEKAMVETVIQNMEAGLRLQQAQLRAQGHNEAALKLVEQNPINWLERPPFGYSGMTEGVEPQRMAVGEWRFDSAIRVLHFCPRRAEYLRGEGGARVACLSWRVSGEGFRLVSPIRWEPMSE